MNDMGFEDVQRIIHQLSLLRVYFYGDGESVGLVGKIDEILAQLDDKTKRLEEASSSINETNRASISKLASVIANEATVSALEYEYNKLHELFEESLEKISDKSSKKSVDLIIGRIRLSQKNKISEDDFKRLERQNNRLKVVLKITLSFLFLSSFVSVALSLALLT